MFGQQPTFTPVWTTGWLTSLAMRLVDEPTAEVVQEVRNLTVGLDAPLDHLVERALPGRSRAEVHRAHARRREHATFEAFWKVLTSFGGIFDRPDGPGRFADAVTMAFVPVVDDLLRAAAHDAAVADLRVLGQLAGEVSQAEVLLLGSQLRPTTVVQVMLTTNRAEAEVMASDWFPEPLRLTPEDALGHLARLAPVVLADRVNARRRYLSQLLREPPRRRWTASVTRAERMDRRHSTMGNGYLSASTVAGMLRVSKGPFANRLSECRLRCEDAASLNGPIVDTSDSELETAGWID